MKIRIETKLIVTMAAIATSLLIVTPFVEAHGNSNGGGKGLTVIVTVHNSDQYAGSEAGVTVATSRDNTIHKRVIVPDSDNFFVKFQFEKGAVDVGEEVAGCVNISDYGISGECASTYNSEDSKPERIDIYLANSNNGNSGDGGDTSSSGSAAANDRSAASNSGATSKSCLMFC